MNNGENVTYTKVQKLSNWFYYNKLYVIVAIVLIIIAASIIMNKVHASTNKADYTFAYVGSTYLPDDTVNAFKQSIADFAEDVNNDGKVIIDFRQYISENSQNDNDTAEYAAASSVNLLGDITDMESHFFILESPALFQYQYQILANSDGSLADETDYHTEDKVYLWSECPVLASLPLGDYTDSLFGEEYTGSSQELLSNLYFARRGYYSKAPKYFDKYNELWDILTSASKGGNQ